MIPKIIHYCWFGGAEKSPLIKKCIATWRKVMPDYELREWNEKNFDLEHAVPFVKEAFAARKWAFIADYVRLYAMFTEGGVYMDTDVKVMRRFDEFLPYSFFTCQESHPDIFVEGSVNADGTRNQAFDQVLGIGLCSAVMGAEKGCPYLKSCLDFYSTIHFDVEHKDDFVIVNLIAKVLEQYGYRYRLEPDQLLSIPTAPDGRQYAPMLIKEPWVFAGMTTLRDDSYAIHLYNGSWLESSKSLKHRIRNQFPTLYGGLQDLFYWLKKRRER